MIAVDVDTENAVHLTRCCSRRAALCGAVVLLAAGPLAVAVALSAALFHHPTETTLMVAAAIWSTEILIYGHAWSCAVCWRRHTLVPSDEQPDLGSRLHQMICSADSWPACIACAWVLFVLGFAAFLDFVLQNTYPAASYWLYTVIVHSVVFSIALVSFFVYLHSLRQ